MPTTDELTTRLFLCFRTKGILNIIYNFASCLINLKK